MEKSKSVNVTEWLTRDLEKTKVCKSDKDFSAFVNASGANSQNGPWLILNAEKILKEINNNGRSILFRLMLSGVYANAFLIAHKYFDSHTLSPHPDLALDPFPFLLLFLPILVF